MDHMELIGTPGHEGKRYFHSATVTGTTSPALIIPSAGREVAVAVTPGTNALVQFTLSDYDAIAAGTAVWDDWPSGTVTVATTDGLSGAVSALRLVSTGASTWRVTA